MMDNGQKAHAASAAAAGSPWTGALVMGVVVFAASILGICTRPENFLASVWPANAVMLGLLIRYRSSSTWAGWLAAAAAFLAADLLTGASLHKAIILNTANLVGVSTAYLVYRRLPPELAGLRQPTAVLHLVMAAAAAGMAAGVVGGVANPLLFNGDAWRGWAFWFSTEFVNYVAILPVLLSAPAWRDGLLEGWRSKVASMPWRRLMPVAALVLSCVAVIAVGGPGAIAFPVPALLWCGLSYRVFPTAVLTLLAECWVLVVVASGYVGALDEHDEMLLVSLRLGASLIALTPIMLSCVMQSRNELLARLQHLAEHDPLTGAFSRTAFHEHASRLLVSGRGTVGMLMIDIDHFKQINDTYGHGAGDEVLVALAARIRQCLRAGEPLGRVGGEEFAVLLCDGDPAALAAVAERMRDVVRSRPFEIADGDSLAVTISVGMVQMAVPAGAEELRRLLMLADSALYRAKAQGRNKVVQAAGPSS